jgi:hypothetical protein
MILLPMAHYLEQILFCVLSVVCHVQNEVMKLLLAYTVFGEISLSGIELDIISLSMLSFPAETSVAKYRTKYLIAIRH